MKKGAVILLLILFLAPALLNAQIKLSIGPVGGVNYNSHSISSISQTATGIGFFGGAQAELEFLSSIGVIANVTYDSKYGKYSTTSTGLTQNLEYKFSYLSIDLLLKYKPFFTGLYFVAGPTLAFNLSSKAVNNYTIWGAPGNLTSDIENPQTLFGIKAGAGFDISIPKLVDISPYVIAGYYFTNAFQDADWKIFSVQAGCYFKFTIL